VNYKKLYDQIIEKRQKDPINEGYSEKHHIKPKSLGGSDNLDNLVELSAREHFLCHYLLAKMYKRGSFEWYKMNHAFMMMKSSSEEQKRYFNSRLYEALKSDFSSIMSFAQKGTKNSQHGTCWICHIDKQENKKVQKIDIEIWLNDGWVKGRSKWKKKFSECSVCKKVFEVDDRATICSDACRSLKRAEVNRERVGWHHSDETKEVIRKSIIETRKKKTWSSFNQSHSAETKEKISKSMRL